MESIIYRMLSQKKNKSSTLVVRGLRVECAYYWCFSKFPLYFWLNFKLKMKQEIEVESMLMTQEVLTVLPSAYAKSSKLQTYVIASGQPYNLHEGVCPFTSIIKDQIAKARSLGILSRHRQWQFFFDKTSTTTDIAPIPGYKKDLQFSREI